MVYLAPKTNGLAGTENTNQQLPASLSPQLRDPEPRSTTVVLVICVSGRLRSRRQMSQMPPGSTFCYWGTVPPSFAVIAAVAASSRSRQACSRSGDSRPLNPLTVKEMQTDFDDLD